MKRQGVSQYKQPHVMLTRGLQLMEELFPNYQAKLHKAGALQTDHLRDTVIVSCAVQYMFDFHALFLSLVLG